MARSRRLVSNPTEPRLRYIEKNFSPSVLVTVGIALFNAMGEDEVAEDLGMNWQARDSFREMTSGDWDEKELVGDIFTHLSDLHEGGEPESTPYDKYLPWLAIQLNRIFKPILKPIKKLPALERYATDILMPLDVGHSQGLPRGYSVELEVASEKRYWLEQRFGSIAEWANAEGVDINQYSAQEALDASSEWGRLQPKGDIVPGEIVYTFDDGWTFQELTTKKQLQCEGRKDVLFHCVKSYKVRDIGFLYRIFSLRDPDGWPHATMEWRMPEGHLYSGGYVAQFKGYQNKVPEKDEVKRAVEFRLNYLDKNLVEEDNRLEVVPPGVFGAPPFVSHLRGFAGIFSPPSGRLDAFVVFELMSGIPRSGYVILESWVGEALGFIHDEEEAKHGPGDVADEATIARVRQVDVRDGYPEVRLTEAWWDWAQWKHTGLGVGRRDELVEQLSAYGLLPSEFAIKNPGKRRKAKRKAPEYKRLLDRSHRLWETYDAKPLKKHLVAFGKHAERMKKSESAKVKAESRRAARAFNAEFRARGWKK